MQRKLKNLIYFLFVTLSFVVGTISCKKNDYPKNDNSFSTSKFLEKSDYSASTKRVANELLKQNKRNNFIQRLIEKDGFVL